MSSSASGTLFTQEELAAHAEGNAVAVVLATVAYLKDQGLSVGDWVRSTGERFAPGWDELEFDDPANIMRLILLNVASGGAEILSVTNGETEAEAVVGPWPSDDYLTFFNVSRDDTDLFFDAFVPITARLGYQFHRYRDGDKVRLRIARMVTD